MLLVVGFDDGVDQVVEVIRIGLLRFRQCTRCRRNAENACRPHFDGVAFDDTAEPGYQRGLNGGDVGLPQFYVGAAHLRALDGCGVRHLNYVGGVFFGLHAQRNTQVGVRQDVIVHHAGRSLGCQDHVHAEGTAHGTDTHE